MEKKIGFVGLGQMGKWMALNMKKAGFDITVCDVDDKAVQFLTEQGANAAGSPATLAGIVDWVFLSLPNTDIVEQVLFGEDGLIRGAKAGLTIVDFGTTSYLPTLDFERRLKEKGVLFADAPVSGMEARAREGIIIALASDDDDQIDDVAEHIIPIPATSDYLLPVLMSVPLQLLAYHMALLRDCDVDQPRNLAKSVTVE